MGAVVGLLLLSLSWFAGRRYQRRTVVRIEKNQRVYLAGLRRLLQEEEWMEAPSPSTWSVLQARRRRFMGYRPRLSLSFALIGFAVRRLPAEMSQEERERWETEMRAAAAALPHRRLRRLRFAFNLWRRGAPAMPPGGERTAQPARDL
jgi:hypothetical protein